MKANERFTESDGYFVEAKKQNYLSHLTYMLVVGQGSRKTQPTPIAKPQSLPPIVLKQTPRGISNASHFFCGGAVIRNSAREFIEQLWAQQQADDDAAWAAKDAAEAAKEDSIEGLRELRAACEAEIDYRRAFSRMMEDENNDGKYGFRRNKIYRNIR
jgi:hypothetical protein